MSKVQTTPLPPVPQALPITLKGDVVTENWGRWFLNLRVKVNTIDNSIVSLAGINSPGTIVTDGNGNFTSVHLTPGTYGDATHVAQVTVGTQGDITNITNVAITAVTTLPLDYISGLKLIWNSATSISVGTGESVIPSTGRTEVVSSTLTLSSLALSASTFYHVYLFDTAGTPTIECVTTAPAAPYQGTARAKTGDTTRRYLGSVVTDGSSNVQPFLYSDGRMLYLSGNNSGVFSVLLNGSATTPTAVSLSSIVPSTCTLAMLRLANNSTSVNMSVAMTTTSGLYLSIPASSGVGSPVTAECPVSSQAIAYQTGGAGGAANIGLFGYVYER